MKTLLVLACALLVPGGVRAQTRGWEPSAGHTETPIWPGAAPDLQPAAGPEHAGMATESIAGKLDGAIRGFVNGLCPARRNREEGPASGAPGYDTDIEFEERQARG